MKKIILLLIFMTLLIAPLIFATEPAFTFEQDRFVDIKIPCEQSDGTFCESDTNCTITIYDKQNLIVVNNKNMTFNPSFYNYTLKRNQVIPTGKYTFTVACVSPSEAKVNSFVFEITSSGEEVQIFSLEIILTVIIYSMILFAFIKEEYVIGMIGAFGLLAIGVYSYSSGLYGFNNVYTQLFSLINIAIGAYILLTGTIEQIDAGESPAGE